ncbi:MAG: CoA-binding protein [Candidatus Dormibacteria bacterium]
MPVAVLLVDWPSQEIPRALLAAGCVVLSANLANGTASAYGVVDPGNAPPSADGVEVMAAEREGDPALMIRALDAMPAHVDAIALFRPEAEHVAIVRRAVALGARAVWVQRGRLADDARTIAGDAGIVVIEDRPESDAIKQLAAIG